MRWHRRVPQVQVVKDAEQVVAYQQAEAAAEQTYQNLKRLFPKFSL